MDGTLNPMRDPLLAWSMVLAARNTINQLLAECQRLEFERNAAVKLLELERGEA